MDRKDWTPEELELKEALNKLYETDTRTPSEPLDLSFMEDSEKKKVSKTRRRLAYVAAIIAVALVSSFATAIFISNDYASAVQEKVKMKMFEMKHGVVVATDEEFAEEGETVWEITDFETAKKAKELVPDLPIPGYVPEGYEFEKLVLYLYNNRRIANYTYDSPSNPITIAYYSSKDNAFDISAFNVIETINTPNSTILLLEDPISSCKACSITYDSAIIIISSTNTTIDSDELLKISFALK